MITINIVKYCFTFQIANDCAEINIYSHMYIHIHIIIHIRVSVYIYV